MSASTHDVSTTERIENSTNEGTSVFITETHVKTTHHDATDTGELESIVSGVSHLSQATLLMKKRKELRQVDNALNAMKEEYTQRIEVCANRQLEIERKQAEMQEQVSRFEKFIKENDSKKSRAEMKAKTEHRLAEANEQKKKILLMQLEKEMKEREALEKQREELMKYRMYLEISVESSDGEYEEIGDILNRYQTLIGTNMDLKSQVRAAEHETDVLRQKIRTLKTETQNMGLVQNSTIHGLQQHLEHLRAVAMNLDIDRQRNDRLSNDRSREAGQIALTITNLYHRCRSSLGDKMILVREDDMELTSYLYTLLQVIATRIVDLDGIVTRYKAQIKAKDLLENSNRLGNKSTDNITRLPPLS